MSFFLVSFFSITNYTQVIDLWLFLLLHHFTDVTLMDGRKCKSASCG